MLRDRVKINMDKYVRFMKIQQAISWMSYSEFYKQLWVCANTYYSWVYNNKIPIKHFEIMRNKFWSEEWFYDCFSINKEEHWNAIVYRKKREAWAFKYKKYRKKSKIVL